MTSEFFKRERRCGPPSGSCRLLWACACWLMAPLKRCSCQSSTFIRAWYLVIVIPQWEKKVGRWVQVGADVSERSRLTGAHLRKKKRLLPWWGRLTCKRCEDVWVCCRCRGFQSSTVWPALLPELSEQILWWAALSRTTGSHCVMTLLSDALNRCGAVWSAPTVVEQGRS